MSHSVQRHLSVTGAAYDEEIRRLIPEYQRMHDEVVGALRDQLPDQPFHVIDLGAGTGALSACIARSFPLAHFTLLDADAEMLQEAKLRLGDRVALRHGSFAEPFGTFDAVVASLSLHHLRTAADKQAVYANIFRALPPGGVFVNADATVPASSAFAEPIRRRWADHLVAGGDTQAQAFARFAQWAEEDRYFSLVEELQMLSAAGFLEVDVRWRVGPLSVVVARRP